MKDTEIIGRIDALVAEEDELHERAQATGGLDQEQARRLRSVEEGLDQCWDLLRQRRARREAGLDPDQAQARDIPTVEHYQQ